MCNQLLCLPSGGRVVINMQSWSPDVPSLLRILQTTWPDHVPQSRSFLSSSGTALNGSLSSVAFQHLGPSARDPPPKPLPPRCLTFPLGSSWAPLLHALCTPRVLPCSASFPQLLPLLTIALFPSVLVCVILIFQSQTKLHLWKAIPSGL